MKRVLLCGDSFGRIDVRFPGLHFSEKLQDCEVINLAQGGASNSMIQVQLHQGLQFSPTHVILLFTAQWRAEYNIYLSGVDNSALKHCVPGNETDDWTVKNIKDFNQNTYTTSAYLRSKKLSKHIIDAYDNHMKYQHVDYETLRTYYMIVSMLDKLILMNIPYCFGLGGFAADYAECRDRILPVNYLNDELATRLNQSVDINLWDHADQSTNYATVPLHHVADDRIQTEFARQCEEILFGNT
jgi:hypothetical protein